MKDAAASRYERIDLPKSIRCSLSLHTHTHTQRIFPPVALLKTSLTRINETASELSIFTTKDLVLNDKPLEELRVKKNNNNLMRPRPDSDEMKYPCCWRHEGSIMFYSDSVLGPHTLESLEVTRGGPGKLCLWAPSFGQYA